MKKCRCSKDMTDKNCLTEVCECEHEKKYHNGLLSKNKESCDYVTCKCEKFKLAGGKHD